MLASFAFTWDPPLARLSIEGELDLATGEELRDVFSRLSSLNCTIVEADFSAVSFIDAYALGILQHEHHRLRSRGGELRVVAASDWFVRVARLTDCGELQVQVPDACRRDLSREVAATMDGVMAPRRPSP